MNSASLNNLKICLHEKCDGVFVVSNTEIVKCSSCNLVRARVIGENGINKKEIYRNYYDQETGGRFNFGVEYLVKLFRFFRAVNIYMLRPKAESILDIGSGRGWMLYFLKKYFKYTTVVGTQISIPAYEFSKEKLKLEIYNHDLLDINWNKKFDIITLWHVLEHVDFPELYIQKIYVLLNKDGLLVLEVPNFNSWTSVLTKKYWLALDLKYHLTFFTPETLIDLLKKYNFKIVGFNTFSLEQSTFTSAQSLVNFFTKTNNYIFNWLQTGGFQPMIIIHLFIFLILFPICFIINFIMYYSKKGEVIHIIAQKND